MTKIGIQLKDENNNDVYPNPFPIGAIYMSVDSRNPSQIFGGTWEQIKDKFLLCAGSNYKAGDVGGNETHSHNTGNHTLTINEIPSHNHTLDNYNASGHNTSYLPVQYSGTKKGYGYNIYTYNAGGNQPHNHGNTGSSSNMPPYLAVYVWRRVA